MSNLTLSPQALQFLEQFENLSLYNSILSGIAPFGGAASIEKDISKIFLDNQMIPKKMLERDS